MVERIKGQIHTMVRQTVLREIVGSDTLRPVAASAKAQTVRPRLRFRFAAAMVEDSGFQGRKALFPVALLASLVLALRQSARSLRKLV